MFEQLDRPEYEKNAGRIGDVQNLNASLGAVFESHGALPAKDPHYSPRLGEHNEKVYGEGLGRYVAALKDKGIV